MATRCNRLGLSLLLLVLVGGCGGGGGGGDGTAALPVTLSPSMNPAVEFACLGAFVPDRDGTITITDETGRLPSAKLFFRIGKGEWHTAVAFSSEKGDGSAIRFHWYSDVETLVAGKRIEDVYLQLRTDTAISQTLGPLVIDNTRAPSITAMEASSSRGVIAISVTVDAESNSPVLAELALSVEGGPFRCATAKNSNPIATTGAQVIVFKWDSDADVPGAQDRPVNVVLRAAVRSGRFSASNGIADLARLIYSGSLLPPTNLLCSAETGTFSIGLSWTNAVDYDSITIKRNGNEIAVLAGTATTYRDTLNGAAALDYEVYGTIASQKTSSAACSTKTSYAPGEFYSTAEMHRPRYEHQAVTLPDGAVLVVGGTDERCFTSIDSIEVFDQNLPGSAGVQTMPGDWVNTDFEGEDLRLQSGGRIFHTVTRITEGNVLVIGGAPDGLVSDAYSRPEHYDRHTRKFTVLTAALEYPRFHHTTVAVREREFYVIGGQIGIEMTVVDPQYPPNDPRFIKDIKTNPSTNTIEVFDSSLTSDDGYGNLAMLVDDNGTQVKLPGSYGRSLHVTVRIAGPDNTLGNTDDMFISVAGVQTMSPLFAPQTRMRRMDPGSKELLLDLDIHDTLTEACFTTPGVFLETPRAHGVMAENVGWRNDSTFDGRPGLSNMFIVCGGSDDVLPTTGAFVTEEFAATFSGFGPGAGISILKTVPLDADSVEIIVGTVLGSEVDSAILNAVRAAVAASSVPVDDRRIGKYFSSELISIQGFLGTVPINRVHTQSVRLVQRVVTPLGMMELGNIFTGAGGSFQVVMGAQVETYDDPPSASGEYFDPNFSLINSFFAAQRNPYDLTSMRDYWQTRQPGGHPTGVDGTWLVTDGLVPTVSFDGYQLIPSASGTDDDRRVRMMQKGRGWHTVSVIPGTNGVVGDSDDCVLFAGGGQGVAAWGGMPVTPSAVIYVPQE